MSSQLGKVDIVHFRVDEGEIKRGEIALYDDNTLDGFLFDNETLRRLISGDGNRIALAIMIYPDHPKEKTDDGNGNVH